MLLRSGTVALLVVALIALLWWLPDGGITGSVEDAKKLILSWGSWGVAGSVGLMVVHSFLPFPSEIIALANGMVYGPLWGSVITWTGAMIGASIAFGLARSLGQQFVMRMLSDNRKRQLATWSREQGGPVLLVARLIPVIAFNLINYAAAFTHISWWTFVWATGLGILPLTILLSVLGENVLDMSIWTWLLLAALALLGWFALRYRRSTREGG
jgi:uncharacterized membrane protein YdjX (TVP38/TMEM64 family)